MCWLKFSNTAGQKKTGKIREGSEGCSVQFQFGEGARVIKLLVGRNGGLFG